MKSTFLLFSLMVFLNTSGFGQGPSLTLKGVVYDKNSRLPVNHVSVGIHGIWGKGTSTDSSGYFEIKGIRLPAKLHISHVSYQPQIVEITNKSDLAIKVFLKPKTTTLPEISVSAIRKIDTVFHEPINVVDYDFLEENIVLLTYVNVFEKYKLCLLDKNEQPVAQISLSEHRPSRLFKSCWGDLYLTTDLGVYAIKADKTSFCLGEKTSLEKYETVLKPCVLATDSFTYFQEYFYQGQAMRYFAFHRDGNTKSIDFPLIEHEHNIDLLIEETGNRFPRSGDVWEANVEPRLAALREESYGLKGMMKIFYPRLYAPLVRHDSLLCLFNHQESEIQFFNQKGTLLSSTPIQYHQYKKWKKQIIYDAKAQTAYTSFDTRWGEQLCPINLKDGTLGEAIPIELPFPGNLKIRDGYLYFLHRDPYQGGRKKMLRKVRISSKF